MTFEEQVTAALRAASREWAQAAYMEGDFPRWLAPRFVAAIEAASYAWHIETGDHCDAAASEAALRALRGSGETPQP